MIKISWGKYAFLNEQLLKSDGNLLKNSDQFLENPLKNFSQSHEGNAGSLELQSVERNILVDILSKDNKFQVRSQKIYPEIRKK